MRGLTGGKGRSDNRKCLAGGKYVTFAEASKAYPNVILSHQLLHLSFCPSCRSLTKNTIEQYRHKATCATIYPHLTPRH